MIKLSMIGNLPLSDPICTSEGFTQSQIVERVGMNVNHVEINILQDQMHNP